MNLEMESKSPLGDLGATPNWNKKKYKKYNRSTKAKIITKSKPLPLNLRQGGDFGFLY